MPKISYKCLMILSMFFAWNFNAMAVTTDSTGVTKPAFYIAEFVVHDKEGIKPYSQQAEDTFKQYGGRYIARRGTTVSLEGKSVEGGIVIIQFNSLKDAEAWYHSPEYQAIVPIRHRTATTRVFIVEGLPSL